MGNVGSLSSALYSQGWDPILVSSDINTNEISHLIIPGVGAYDAAMQLLHQKNLTSFIHEFVATGKPIMGICLGMQILSNTGAENAITKGLGLIQGHVAPMKKSNDFKLPHVGWNNLIVHTEHILLDGIKPNVDFYFVHSYCFHAQIEAEKIASTEYLDNFSSIIAKNNIFGVQFHPEKSQKNGLKILDNFCLWDGKC